MITIFSSLCFVVLLMVSHSLSAEKRELEERKVSQFAVQSLVCPVINTSCPAERVFYNDTIHEEAHIFLNALPDQLRESWSEWCVRIVKGSVFIVTIRFLMQPLFALFDAIWDYFMRKWGVPYLESFIIYLEEFQKKRERRMNLAGQHIDTQ